MNDTIHRDIFKDVIAAFERLKAKNPNKDAKLLMKIAKDNVRAVAYSNTALIHQMVWGKR